MPVITGYLKGGGPRDGVRADVRGKSGKPADEYLIDVESQLAKKFKGKKMVHVYRLNGNIDPNGVLEYTYCGVEEET